MKKLKKGKLFLIIFGFFILSISVFLFYFGVFKPNSMLSGSKNEEIKEKTKVFIFDKKDKMIISFVVEIADNFFAQRRGLMFRENLEADSGMLFVFKEEKPRYFWMKNTLIPLDIIFISKGKEIVSISKNAMPCKKEKCPNYPSNKPAKFVLEINAGLSGKFNISTGNKVKFQLPH